jgi:RNA polymerase sigma-70 factor (ECF subfamily)
VNDDTQLIDQSLQGDPQAFGQLMEKYQARLYNTMVHVVGCPEEAEDVVQEAFVQVFLKLDTFRGQSAFYPWLYRIAFNQSINRRRRKRPWTSVEDARAAAGEEPLDSAETPGERLLRQERADQLHKALASLCEEHRAILILREIEGCCYQTIAQILDLPVGTVRSRLHRARLQLRDRLKEMLPEGSFD